MVSQKQSKLEDYEQSSFDSEYENLSSFLQDLLDNQETLTIWQNSPNIIEWQISLVTKQLQWSKNNLLHILTKEELNIICQLKEEVVRLELQLEQSNQFQAQQELSSK